MFKLTFQHTRLRNAALATLIAATLIAPVVVIRQAQGQDSGMMGGYGPGWGMGPGMMGHGMMGHGMMGGYGPDGGMRHGMMRHYPPPAGTVTEPLPEANSKAARLFNQYCSQCHVQPSPAQHSAAEWPSVVKRMKTHMQDLHQRVNIPSASEFEAIIAYLQKHASTSVTVTK
jgi:hypothetical protein